MRAVIHKLHAGDIEVDYLLHKGKPAASVVEVAEKLGADLRVMFTCGRDNLMDSAVGTITEHVIDSAPCPILVIPNKD